MKRYREYLRSDEVRDIPRTTLNRWKRRRPENVEPPVDSIENESDEDRSEEEMLIDAPSQSDSICSFSDQSSQISREEVTSTFDAYEYVDHEEDYPAWLNQPLHVGSKRTVGETVKQILEFYLKNALTKKSLEDLLKMQGHLLPQPNSLPKTKYMLSKLIDPLMTTASGNIKKHRFCNACSYYLGDWNKNPVITVCEACDSDDVGGMFVEYDIRSILIDAFEVRKLGTYMDMHKRYVNDDDDGYIRDIADGSEYKKLKELAIPGDYDVFLVWNTDGMPTANSSNGQLWAIQAQIVNVPPNYRRAFQFTCGLYYSTVSKPEMNCFLKPFVNAMKDLYINGFDWCDKLTNVITRSKVIAPIATLDCPARAAVQNVSNYNGLHGCSFCEHPGQTCRTGDGHNHIYPPLDNEPPQRTREAMLIQAEQVINEEADIVKGVKGPAIVATMPFFNCAVGFVPDYMHAFLLGVMRMLIACWCQGKNKDRPFYLKKSLRDQIDKRLQEIKPPDVISRTPRPMKYSHFWKAAELRSFLLFYSSILLNGILPVRFYQHYLLFVRATQILLQSRIHVNEIDLAETLLHLFVSDIKNLYGLEKCSFNVHQLIHIPRFVRYWGPMWAWSAFPFEDGNGYLSRITHGPNKIHIEIFNTLKYMNALQILKHRLPLLSGSSRTHRWIPLGSLVNISLTNADLVALQTLPSINPNVIRARRMNVYRRIKKQNEVLTSKLYTQQRKRENYYIVGNEGSLLGAIKFFVIGVDEILFAIVEKFIEDTDRRKMIIHQDTEMRFDACIKPIRRTYCVEVIPVDRIETKFLRVENYACILPNVIERNL